MCNRSKAGGGNNLAQGEDEGKGPKEQGGHSSTSVSAAWRLSCPSSRAASTNALLSSRLQRLRSHTASLWAQQRPGSYVSLAPLCLSLSISFALRFTSRERRAGGERKMGSERDKE
uniref:Uncharacterized protein n=1 Tax=Esox lucius TaxID=8010 RepID=A0A6Q2XCC9_ESOLU